MKFTDGFWQVRPGVEMQYAANAHRIEVEPTRLRILAPTTIIRQRGDTLNRSLATIVIDSPASGVARVAVEHWTGGARRRGVALAEDPATPVDVHGTADGGAVLTTGDLEVVVAAGDVFSIVFRSRGRVLTSLGHKSIARALIASEARLDPGIATPPADVYSLAQLDLAVGETIYGLGERFGPLVKNGQTVEIWNADGGTSSEQAYKSIPFYLSSRGYGVLVNDFAHVSFEVGSEIVERVQFSVPGQRVEFLVVDGPTPADVLERHTGMTGRPARLPAWSYGLWLSTSFTTSYDEATVNGFLAGMAERDIPLSVFHFDCFWMREFQWCDFTWDPEVFPDPEGMLGRLHAQDLRVCVWINPYIGQASPLFDEARRLGHLVRRPDGSVWQWDMWQAGMGLVDFTSAEATAWFQAHLRRLLAQGVDCFKTDFGERIPIDVVWADGSPTDAMHNRYTDLYNRAVFDVLEEERGAGEAVLFARSASIGGQALPVHWGGDSTSTFASMAETLRGGLSLAACGFGFWSHDIGGFEGTPDPTVFKRWTAFGMLSSHSRFHGSSSYRVPWLFDEAEGRAESDPESAVSVTRTFARLKMSLMPYLHAAGVEASERGTPMMRPMHWEFPDDPAVAYLDRQYLLGGDLLVAPVFSPDGSVSFYLPAGRWTSVLTGETVDGGTWRREVHGLASLPLYLRPGGVLLRGTRDDRPDYDYLDDLRLDVSADGADRDVTALAADGRRIAFRIRRAPGLVTIIAETPLEFRARIAGSPDYIGSVDGKVELT